MAKYTFDTKLSVLMKDPEVMKLVDEYCPGLINHPMKDMALAMGFTPNKALAFIGGKLPEEKIEEFRLRLEAIE